MTKDAMQPPPHFAALIHRFNAVGAALARVNLNNTHSGNMSLRDPGDPERFFITASGSMCGALAPEEIVPVSFSDMRWSGARQPSSETNTHRRVLELPGVNACVHCHAPAVTTISLESPNRPMFLQKRKGHPGEDDPQLFQPVDFFGAGLLGAVSVGTYTQTVGSSEMEDRIPCYLRDSPLTVVKGHGPFARGQSLMQCLCWLSVLENSARLASAARRRGVDVSELQRLFLEEGFGSLFPEGPRLPEVEGQGFTGAGKPPETRSLACWQAYNFDHGLSAYAVGSLSCRTAADEMMFSPTAAAPGGVDPPLLRLPLGQTGPQAADTRLHRLIYARTPYAACAVAPSPLATAEAMAVLTEAVGGGLPAAMRAGVLGPASELPVIVPIDAEAAFHKVRVPVAPPAALGTKAPDGFIPAMLTRGNGCAVIAGFGVIAAGASLAQAIYRLSLTERIAHFRQEVHLNHRLLGGAPVSDFEQG